MVAEYAEFLESKRIKVKSNGFDVASERINSKLFAFQRDLTRWAIRKGRCALWADTGLGKTLMQVEFARLMDERSLIIAPLSVARQTVREATKINVEVRYVRSQPDVSGKNKLWITNYEMIDDFDFSQFGTVILDESSILKALDSKTRKKLTVLCRDVPYRLCCSATPAPNDYTEIGNHAEYLGVCTMGEMLGTFFINANREHTIISGDKTYQIKGSNKGGQEWRIKHHAEDSFFQWLSSWAITLTKPSDLGYDDDGFILPPLNIIPHFVRADYVPDDQLFFTHLKGLGHRADIRRQGLAPRLNILTDLVNKSDEQWIVWVGLDEESKAVTAAVEGAIEVKGSDSPERKSQAFEDFQDRKYKVLVSKSKIAGFGLNLQNASRMAFFGLSDSWESYYQSVRREWRYGQMKPVDVHIILSDAEAGIYQNVMRKDAMATRLRQKLIECVRSYEKGELGMDTTIYKPYQEKIAKGEEWTLMLGDSCERLKELGDESIDLSVYSPPFADLFTYSASDRDLGNSRNWKQFFKHYRFIIQELLRVTKPGRLTCVHTSDIPAIAQKDGYIGVKDFPGAVIRAYQRAGWVLDGRAFVPKNPQAQAIRTHSQALLFVQLRKDSAQSRPALIDQILLFKKPGENAIPITPVANGELDNETWIDWANGVWTGIYESDTLQCAPARGADDEKHICPLQLATIERCIKLWSNPGELVLSPFAGIGSECYQAIRFGRKAIGIELKPEYFNVAVSNLQKAERESKQVDLFSWSKEVS